MKLELEEYRTEATHLKNQQATIRRLEERNRQLEQQVSNFWNVLTFSLQYMSYLFVLFYASYDHMLVNAWSLYVCTSCFNICLLPW